MSGSKLQSVSPENGIRSTEKCPVSCRSAHHKWNAASDVPTSAYSNDWLFIPSWEIASRFMLASPPRFSAPTRRAVAEARHGPVRGPISGRGANVGGKIDLTGCLLAGCGQATASGETRGRLDIYRIGVKSSLIRRRSAARFHRRVRHSPAIQPSPRRFPWARLRSAQLRLWWRLAERDRDLPGRGASCCRGGGETARLQNNTGRTLCQCVAWIRVCSDAPIRSRVRECRVESPLWRRKAM